MKEVKEYLQEIGKRGGKKTAKKGRSYYSNLGKLGMQKRWAKKKDEKDTSR